MIIKNGQVVTNGEKIYVEVQTNEDELEDGSHLTLITRRLLTTKLRRMMLMIKETTYFTHDV